MSNNTLDNSKLYQFLLTFSKSEWKKFEAFVQSPYFQTNQKCVELLDLFKQAIFAKNKTSYTVSFFTEQLCPTAKNPEGYLRVIMGQVTQLIEEFWVLQRLDEELMYKKQLFHRQLLERQLFSYYESSHQKIQKAYQQAEKKGNLKKGDAYYFDTYLQSIVHHEYLQITQLRNIHSSSSNQVIQSLDEYYWIYRLRLIMEQLSLQHLYGFVPDFNFEQQIEQIENFLISKENPLLKLYYSASMMLYKTKEEEIYCLALQSQLKDYATEIPKRELNILYTLLINFLIRKSRKSNQENNEQSKVFHLYKKMVDDDILCLKEYLTPGKFKNIVILGCRFKEFDWTKDFIDSYQHRLEPTHRTSAYHFNMAAFHFFQQQYEQAQEHLFPIEKLDIYYDMGAKSLLVRIYYEQKEWRVLEQLLGSFKDFLRKKKNLQKNVQKGFINFINFVMHLIKAQEKYNPNKKSTKTLLKKLESYPIIHHKKWLLEKIQELEE